MQPSSINKLLLLCLLLIAWQHDKAQVTVPADSIRLAYHIPELAYAVVSADSVLELQVTGIKCLGTDLKASLSDRFRIGSNTKAITALIAAQMVTAGYLRWDTKFADLFPELKNYMRPAYRSYSLLQLLSFRTRLPKWTYTNTKPNEVDMKGSPAEQRMQFALWVLKQKPVKTRDSINFSNPAYVLAGLMLEKATGKSYEQLVAELGTAMQIEIGFGAPNVKDSLQTWGHGADLSPERPTENPKLTWLTAAGNLNLTTGDYARFIQLQLRGLQKGAGALSRQQFEWMHYGLPRFALGWFNHTEYEKHYSYNTGNPGTFYSYVLICSEANRALLILTNIQSEEAAQGVEQLTARLRQRYHF